MRIALVIRKFDPAAGGAERWTWDFAHWLASRDHEVTLVCESFARPNSSRIRQCRIELSASSDSRRRIEFAVRAEQSLRQNHSDVIHDMGSGWYCDVFMPHGGARLGSFEQNLKLTPALVRPLKKIAARWLPRYRAFRQLELRQYGNSSHRIIALSQRVRQDMLRHYGVARDRIDVVYNGVDTTGFTPQLRDQHRDVMRRELALDDSALTFLLVAHNFRLKGVSTAIRALAKLRQASVLAQLVVVGNGRPRKYQRLAASSSVAGQVRFVGPADSGPYYGACDVYLHPTWYDPCSLVALEALGAGLPVITTAQNGVSELIQNGREGFVLNDPGDADTLSVLMKQFCDPRLRSGCSRHARALAMANNIQSNYAKVLSVYEKATTLRTSRAAA